MFFQRLSCSLRTDLGLLDGVGFLGQELGPLSIFDGANADLQLHLRLTVFLGEHVTISALHIRNLRRI